MLKILQTYIAGKSGVGFPYWNQMKVGIAQVSLIKGKILLWKHRLESDLT